MSSRSGAARRTVKFTLSLVENNATSSVSARLPDGYYKIHVRQDSTSKGDALLSMDLQRSDADGPGAMELAATTRVQRGKRLVLGEVVRADGTRCEVAVTVH